MGQTYAVPDSDIDSDALSADVGGALALEQGNTTVRAVFPWDEHDGRRPGYAYSMFIPTTATGAFDECWIDMWPLNEHVNTLALTVIIPSGSNDPVQVEQYSLNPSLAAQFTGPQLYANRTTRYATVAAIGIAAALGAVSIWRRRLEVASDLHAGVTRTDMTVKLLIETALVACAAPLIASPAIVWIITANAVENHGAMWTLAAVTLMGTMGAALAGALAATALIRERRLFIYFKRQ